MSLRDEPRDRPIRVGVADKSPLVQAALTHLLEQDPRFELVNVWPDGESLLQAVDGCRLDVVISGWVIQPGEGKYILDRLRARPDPPRVVIYTGASSDAVPAQSMAHHWVGLGSGQSESVHWVIFFLRIKFYLLLNN